MKKLIISIISLFFSFTSFSQSPHIHVDQFGYTPNANKVAVLSDPQIGQFSNLSYTPSSSIELREYGTNLLINSYSPQQWSNGDTDSAWSGDKGWLLDFSDLQTPGDYYLVDQGSQDTSAVFSIAYDIYDEALKAASRMFYYNRCNMAKEAPYAESNWVDATNNFMNPLQDANCRYIFDSGNVSLEKDLTGGWFDAGDYNKYVTFTVTTIHDLLWAYRINPDVFTDNNNIPESGNGIPDILDELMWELDWLMKMSNPDGSCHIKMGSSNYGENADYPPSNNYGQRFYGPTCTSASLSIASVFAHAATVLEDFGSLTTYVNDLRARAEISWDYVLPFYNNGTLEYNCDNGEIVAGDADFNADSYNENMIAAAIYLFESTGDASYNTFVVNNYLDALVFGATPNNPSNPSSYDDEWWDINHLFAQDAYMNYGNLPGSDANVASDFADSFQAMVNNNWESFLGMNNLDLYQARMPNYYLGWGSNSSQSTMGNLNYAVVTQGMDNGNPDTYYNKASNHLHYLHGLNPMGKLYLSNMYGKGGDRCADEIYHAWFADGSIYDNALTSSNGPAPGFLAGGPNHTYTGSLTPPSSQPYLKSYSDINDTGSSSWEITEPAIYYQAAYIRLLSSIMALDVNPSTNDPHIEVSNTIMEIFPNPVDQYFVIKGDLALYDIDIINAAGQVIQTINSTNSEEIIDTSTLGSGIYLIRMENISNSNLFVQKIIKP